MPSTRCPILGADTVNGNVQFAAHLRRKAWMPDQVRHDGVGLMGASGHRQAGRGIRFGMTVGAGMADCASLIRPTRCILGVCGFEVVR
jgi:hypothetical protein